MNEELGHLVASAEDRVSPQERTGHTGDTRGIHVNPRLVWSEATVPLIPTQNLDDLELLPDKMKGITANKCVACS